MSSEENEFAKSDKLVSTLEEFKKTTIDYQDKLNKLVEIKKKKFLSEVKKFNNRPILETPIGDYDFKKKHYKKIQKMNYSNPITDYDKHFDKDFEKFCDRVNNFKMTLRSENKNYNFCDIIKNYFLKDIIDHTYTDGDLEFWPTWYVTKGIPEDDLFFPNFGPFPRLLKEIREEINKLKVVDNSTIDQGAYQLGGKRRRSTKRKTKRSKRKQKRNTKRRASHRRRR